MRDYHPQEFHVWPKRCGWEKRPPAYERGAVKSIDKAHTKRLLFVPKLFLRWTLMLTLMLTLNTLLLTVFFAEKNQCLPDKKCTWTDWVCCKIHALFECWIRLPYTQMPYCWASVPLCNFYLSFFITEFFAISTKTLHDGELVLRYFYEFDYSFNPENSFLRILHRYSTQYRVIVDKKYRQRLLTRSQWTSSPCILFWSKISLARHETFGDDSPTCAEQLLLQDESRYAGTIVQFNPFAPGVPHMGRLGFSLYARVSMTSDTVWHKYLRRPICHKDKKNNGGDAFTENGHF